MTWRDGPHFTTASIDWATSDTLYAALHKEFSFTMDPCPVGGIDGLSRPWHGQRVYCNPPYGRGIAKWLAKAREAILAVYLLPSRTDTAWWHDYALRADEIRFIRGRLKFTPHGPVQSVGWSNNAAPFPSVILVYRRGASPAAAPREERL